MLTRFRADRAFDGFDAGQEVELDPADEQHARWINTGYLEPLDDAPADEEPGNEAAPPPAEEGPGDGTTDDGAAGAGPVARPRRRN